ncbi:MAG: hypothetical protein AAF576_11550 [Pseudomonadota bacterium]
MTASRARILAPALAMEGRSYRDNDMPEMAMAPCAMPQTAPAGPFIDLDAQPLTLAHMASAKPPTLAPAPDPDQKPDNGAAKLTPAFMRRILYLATTPAGQEPAYGRCQANLDGLGLRYGLGRFTQASGDLGRLLQAMANVDCDAFATTFGPDADFPEASAKELLAVTTAQPAAPGGLGADLPQLQPASGKLVWSKDWITRFKAAAKVPAFQAVQFKTTAQVYLLPLLRLAQQLGLNSEKGLALLAERAIQMGMARAVPALLAAVSPLKSDAMRTAALAHVAPGMTIEAFQKAEGLGDTPGLFGDETHARVLELLRSRKDAPVQMPSPQVMVDQIVSFFTSDSTQAGLVAAIAGNPALSLDLMDVSTPDMGQSADGTAP